MKLLTKLTVIFCCGILLLLSIYCTKSSNAQYSYDIAINEDGSIIPSTAPLICNGNTYTLTDDIQATIYVYRNYTFLDGAGHTVEKICGAEGTENKQTWNVEYRVNTNITITNFYINNGYIGFNSQVNATIANNTMVGCSIIGISLAGEPSNQSRIYGNTLINCSCGVGIRGIDCELYNNTFLNCQTGMFFNYGDKNKIFANYFNNSGTSIALNGGSDLKIFQNHFLASDTAISCTNINGQLFASNHIYLNDFINNNLTLANARFMAPNPTNNWDNGTAGNYYTEYFSKYPNATQGNNTGISSTPYIMDEDNIDRFPLMEPVEDYLTMPTTPLPTKTTPPVTDPVPLLIVGITVLAVAAAIVAVIYIRKSRAKALTVV